MKKWPSRSMLKRQEHLLMDGAKQREFDPRSWAHELEPSSPDKRGRVVRCKTEAYDRYSLLCGFTSKDTRHSLPSLSMVAKRLPLDSSSSSGDENRVFQPSRKAMILSAQLCSHNKNLKEDYNLTFRSSIGES